MSPYYKLIVLAIVLPLFSSAQDSYPGYIVKLNGDTLRGEVSYHGDNNVRSIRFKAADGKELKFGASDIKSFGVNAGHPVEYHGYAGTLSMNKTDTDKPLTEKDTSVRADTVFLRVLQKGKYITLLTQSDNYKNRFFVEETSATIPSELIFRVYWSNGTAVGSTVYENIYQRQLFGLAQKYNVATDDLSAFIAKTEYKEEDLIKVSAKINGVSARDALKNNTTKAKPFNVFFAIAAGALILVALVLQFEHKW